MNRKAEQKLIDNIKKALPELLSLSDEYCDSVDDPEHETVGEDGIYRYFHQSYKVYWLQNATEKIVDRLRKLNPAGPDSPLDDFFAQIVREGTGEKFEPRHNADWATYTRPIVEAFFHARWMLDMAIKYGRALDEPPGLLPTGWAAVLTLYHLR